MVRFAPFILLAVTACHAHTISPSEMTYSAIGETIYRIHLYAKINGTLPSSLAVLPVRDNYANRTLDGWNRPIIYKVTPDGVLSLTSLGSDGLPGGTGEEKDIVVRYRGKDKNGRVIAGNDLWTVDGEIHSEPQQGAPGDAPNAAHP